MNRMSVLSLAILLAGCEGEKKADAPVPTPKAEKEKPVKPVEVKAPEAKPEAAAGGEPPTPPATPAEDKPKVEGAPFKP